MGSKDKSMNGGELISVFHFALGRLLIVYKMSDYWFDSGIKGGSWDHADRIDRISIYAHEDMEKDLGI